LAVGTLHIDLERFRNLNNPFEIQITQWNSGPTF
jgi:hypothetical protein